jgi:hypothetical protein
LAQGRLPCRGQLARENPPGPVSVRPANADDRYCRRRASAGECEDGRGCHAKATSPSRSAPQTALATAGQPSTGATS